MTIKELKEKHPEIYYLALRNQILQGNKPNDGIDLQKDANNGNFEWKKTREGFVAWEKLQLYGETELLYKCMGKKKHLSLWL